MNEAIEIRSLLIKLQEMLIGKILLTRCHWRQYQLDTILELLLVAVGERRLQPVYVERVADEVLIDLNEELVTLKSAEPVDPSEAVATCPVDTAFDVHLIR
jgi:hypothetical protein